MSDDVGMEVGKHVLSGGGAVGAFAVFTRWLEGKKSEEMSAKLEAFNTGLALVQQKLDLIVRGVEKADSMREDVALMKASVDALHSRGDRFDEKIAILEAAMLRQQQDRQPGRRK